MVIVAAQSFLKHKNKLNQLQVRDVIACMKRHCALIVVHSLAHGNIGISYAKCVNMLRWFHAFMKIPEKLIYLK